MILFFVSGSRETSFFFAMTRVLWSALATFSQDDPNWYHKIKCNLSYLEDWCWLEAEERSESPEKHQLNRHLQASERWKIVKMRQLPAPLHSIFSLSLRERELTTTEDSQEIIVNVSQPLLPSIRHWFFPFIFLFSSSVMLNFLSNFICFHSVVQVMPASFVPCFASSWSLWIQHFFLPPSPIVVLSTLELQERASARDPNKGSKNVGSTQFAVLLLKFRYVSPH